MQWFLVLLQVHLSWGLWGPQQARRTFVVQPWLELRRSQLPCLVVRHSRDSVEWPSLALLRLPQQFRFPDWGQP